MSFNVSVKISGDGTGARNALKDVAAGASDAASAVEQSQRRMASGVDAIGAKLSGLQGMFRGLAATLGGALAAGKLMELADAVTTLRNRLELATGSAAAAGRAYQDLFDIAQRSRTSFTELGSVYATMARAGNANLTVVEAIGNAMAISGGSAQGMQAALTQLGQGMSAGVLRGEELNSVMEQAPRLAKALADGLGVPIGQLKALGEQGQLTTERVMEALTVSAPRLAEEMQRSSATIAQGLTVANNAFTKLVGEMDNATGASRAISGALQALGGGLNSLAGVIKENQAVFAMIGTALASAALAGGIMATKGAIVALTLALPALGMALMGPVGAALAIAAALGAATAAWVKYRESTRGLENEAARLRGPVSIYDKGDERNPAKRAAMLREIEAKLALRTLDGVDTSAEDARFNRSAEAMTRRVQLQADLAALTAKQQGLDKDYYATLKTLQQAYEEGLLPLEEYRQRVQDLVAATKLGKEAQDAATEARKAADKALEQFDRAAADYMKEREELRMKQLEGQAKADLAAMKRYDDEEAAIEKRLQYSRDVVQAIERETQLVGLSNVEREVSIALWDAEAKGIKKGTYEYQQLEETLRKAIGRREQMRETSAAWAEEAERIKRLNAEIGQSLADALMQGGRSAAEYLKGLFRSLVLRPIIEAVVRPVAGLVTSLLGMAGPAQAGGAGGASGAASTLGGLSSLLSGAGSIFRSGVTLATSGGWGGVVGGLQGAGAMMTNGSIMAGISQAAGTVAGAIGPALIGRAVGQAISGGRSAFGSSGNSAINAGTVIGAIVGGPIGAGIGAAIGGIVNRAFGRGPREVTATGVTGSFGGGSFTGQAFADWRQKGGWFTSSRSGTDLTPLQAETQDALNAGSQAMLASAREYARVLSLPVEYMQDVTSTARITLTGKAEEDTAAITAAIDAYGDALTSPLKSLVDRLSLSGERTVDTLRRLAGIQSFSTAINGLGGVFSRVARLSFEARQSLGDLAGSLDAFASKAMAFVQEYYNRDEIAGLKAGEIQAVLQGLGIQQDISTRDDFRRLVDAVDVSTTAGREQLNALLDIAPAAAQVFDYLAETGRTLSAAAALAPTTSPLSSAFDQQDTVAAVNSVRTGVDLVREAIVELTDVVRGGSGLSSVVPAIPADYEVNVGGA